MANDLEELDWGDSSLDDDVEAGGGGFDPIAKGEYDLQVHSAELVTTNNKKGKMVKVRLDLVQNGQKYGGRVIFDQMVVAHSESDDAQRIGRSRFAQLCKSAGFEKRPTSTSELVGHVVRGYVDVETSTYKGEERTNNVVKNYKKSSATATPPAEGEDFDDEDIPF